MHFPPHQDSSERQVRLHQSTAVFQGKKQRSAAFPCCSSALLSTCRRISLRLGALPRSLSVTELLPASLPALGTQTLFFCARRAFLAVMCLSVPLFAIQTFPLFLSFGIFLISPLVAFWVLEGLAAPQAPVTPPWDRSPVPCPFLGGFGCAGLQGRSLQGFQEPSTGNGDAGGVSSKESPHSLQDLAEVASPLPKTLPKLPQREKLP